MITESNSSLTEAGRCSPVAECYEHNRVDDEGEHEAMRMFMTSTNISTTGRNLQRQKAIRNMCHARSVLQVISTHSSAEPSAALAILQENRKSPLIPILLGLVRSSRFPPLRLCSAAPTRSTDIAQHALTALSAIRTTRRLEHLRLLLFDIFIVWNVR